MLECLADSTCRSRSTCTCRLADALIDLDLPVVMDSRLVIRVENMVTTSSLEVLGVEDLNGTTSMSN